jgi:cobaltochelatase CobT
MKDNLVRLTETALERSARLLSRQHDVKVVFKGDKAITDSESKIMILPTVPHDAPAWYSAILNGHMSKELGYFLFSDVKTALPKLPDAHATACFLLAEDLRTIRKYEEIYPGSITDAQLLHNFKFDMIRKHWAEVPAVDRVLAAAFMRAKYGPEAIQSLGSNVRKLVEECNDALGSPDTLDDSIEAGLKVAELLRDLLPPPIPSPPSAQSKEGQKEEEPDDQEQEENEEENESESEENQAGQTEDPDAELKEQLYQSLSGDTDGGMEEAETEPDAFESDDTTYRIYSTENDSIEDIEPNPTAEAVIDLDELRNSTRAHVVVMKQRLTNSLRSMTLARRTFNHEAGDLDPDALVSLCLKSSDRVFQQKSAAMKLDVAVSIAIDHSYSMSMGKDPTKIWLAAQAAITIGDVLSILKVPFMVYGYSTHMHAEKPPAGDLSQYSRWGSLWIRNYCNFGRPWREGAINLTQAPSNVKIHTYDGESVLYGIRQLLARKEKRKILFVLSDGLPQPGHGNEKRCMSFLRRVVESGTQAGVEIVGFGIQSAAVQHFFPKHLIIRKLEDIVGEPLNILDKALRHNQVLK